MRKIFLHIGCGKTGSSAIQVWLNQNSDHLEKLNIYYPTYGIKIKDDHAITSGNGTAAVSAIQTGKSKEYFHILNNEHPGDILLSSEAFQMLSNEQLAELKDVLGDLQIQPVIIAYVRDLVDILNSGYSQLVKRHSFTQKFRDYVLGLKKPEQIQQFEVIGTWNQFFENITVLHYDSERKALDRSFLRALSLDDKSIPVMKKNVVNRALSSFELELLRHINEIFVARFGTSEHTFATRISDALLKLNPEEKTSIIYDMTIENHLSSTFGCTIQEFNKKYFFGEQRLSIFRPEGKAVSAQQEPIDERFLEALRVIMSMVTSMDAAGKSTKPSDENKQPLSIRDDRVIGALYNEATRLESKNLSASLDLMVAAKVLRPNGPLINARIAEYKTKIFKHSDDSFSISWDFAALNIYPSTFDSNIQKLHLRKKLIIRLGNLVQMLILEGEDGGEAVWYYDSDGIYLGDEIGTLEISSERINRITGIIFQRLLSELSGDVSPAILLPLMKSKNTLRSQVYKIVNLIKAERASIDSANKELANLILEKGRDAQDRCIAEADLKNIIKFNYRNEVYSGSHGMFLNGFTTAYPCTDSNKNYLIIFVSGFDASKYSAIDCLDGLIYEDISKRPPTPSRTFLAILLEHILSFSDELAIYLSRETLRKAALLRSPHIGHNLWNEISALYRVCSKGLATNLSEAILLGGKELDVWLEMEHLFPVLKFNRDFAQLGALQKYLYNQKIFPIRLGDDYISKSLAEKIITSSNALSETPPLKEENELRIVFGLRVGNRTWLNQKEGLTSIAEYLSRDFKKLTIIIDGRNSSAMGDKLIFAPHEIEEENSLEYEREIAESLIISFPNDNVNIVNLIGEPVHKSISWISSADFFIAPWGAALSKYKWVCNLPGVILCSNWNRSNRHDLQIYEDASIREGATKCFYVDRSHIVDKDCTSNFIRTRNMENHPSLADFIVDIEGIKLAIDELLIQIGKAP